MRILLLSSAAAAALSVFVMSPSNAGAQAPASTQGFEAFKLVATRNVFDPERRAITPVTQRTLPAGVVRSAMTLTGTMVTASKSLAFFGSSRPEYNKVAKLDDTVGEFRVVKIEPHEVTLEQAGQTTVLGVGKQIPLAGTEPAPAGTSTEPGAAAPAVAPLSAPAASDSGPTTDKAEILRRMMQRRQQEMSR